MAKKRIKTELAAVFGQEPDFSKTKVKKGSYNILLTDALQWYGQYGGAIDSNSLRVHHKQWLTDWALDNGFKDGDFTIPNQGKLVHFKGQCPKCGTVIVRGGRYAETN